ncbi:MAG: hypothetical protein M1826_000716 [Phylliscum demangeonii]|nr:MAG: hypothetical protein M1826_000716 [Phylliscum demangeonii]
MPNSLQGLAALANERIDDAIARGQFKNLPRGKAIARDYNASSPFLDTTEYFMNKIIQKQQIVPPWIEKQQELARAVNTFRDRLRSDWKRHAARTIASGGGTLQAQISRAAGYAAAERRLAPAARKRPAEVEEERGISQADHSVTVAAGAAITPPMTGPSPYPLSPLPPPFRDPAWEESERSYQALSISNINTLTRSYNLMAPDMAKKPYFTLERELRACYADVAPQLVNEIHERARAPVIQVEKVDHRPGGMLEKFGGHKAQVYDSRKPKYGFREFLRDLWRSSKAAGG